MASTSLSPLLRIMKQKNGTARLRKDCSAPVGDGSASLHLKITLGGIRTPDTRLRTAVFYPAELRGRAPFEYQDTNCRPICRPQTAEMVVNPNTSGGVDLKSLTRAVRQSFEISRRNDPCPIISLARSSRCFWFCYWRRIIIDIG